MLTKYHNQRFEFIFTGMASSSDRLFSSVQAVHKAYDNSRLYRDLKLRGGRAGRTAARSPEGGGAQKGAVVRAWGVRGPSRPPQQQRQRARARTCSAAEECCSFRLPQCVPTCLPASLPAGMFELM